MKKIILALALVGLISACQTTKDAPNLATLEVDFSW